MPSKLQLISAYYSVGFITFVIPVWLVQFSRKPQAAELLLVRLGDGMVVNLSPIWLVVLLPLLYHWLSMLFDAIKKSPAKWSFIVFFGHPVGATLYYFLRYKKEGEI